MNQHCPKLIADLQELKTLRQELEEIYSQHFIHARSADIEPEVRAKMLDLRKNINALLHGLAWQLEGEKYDLDLQYNIIKKLGASQIWPFHNDIAVVLFEKGSESYFQHVDRQGNIISRKRYRTLGDFSDGLASFSKKNKKDVWFIQYMDINEKVPEKFKDLEFGYAWRFHDGLAKVMQDEKVFFIDTNGQEPKDLNRLYFANITDFNEGIARINQGGQISHINTNRQGWEAQNAMRFDVLDEFENGFARAKQGDQTWLIHKTEGKMDFQIIKYDGYEIQSNPCEDRVILLSGNKGESHRFYTFGTTDGNILHYHDGDFLEVKDFSEGLAPVNRRGKWFFVDKDLAEPETLKGQRYDFAEPFSDGLALVGNLVAGKLQKFFIDKKGNNIFNHFFEDASSFHEGLARVKKNGKCFYINKRGKEPLLLRGQRFDKARSFDQGVAFVKIGNTQKIIDRKGRIHNEVEEVPDDSDIDDFFWR